MVSKRFVQRAVVGTYNRHCDKSGFTFKRNELVYDPDTKMIVHPQFADRKHPSDLPQKIVYTKKVRLD